MDEHEDHDTATAVAEQTETQKQLERDFKQRDFKQKIQEREKELQEVGKAVETLKSSAQTAVEDSERVFTEMIRSIERRRSEVTELIRAQEKAEVSRAEEHLKRLEQEIAELKRRDAELEQLSHTEDHIHFLKKVASSRDSPRITFSLSVSFKAVKKSVSLMKAQLDDIFKQQGPKISAAVSDVQASLPLPTIREELLQYSCHFTLDPNTAYRELHLSDGNRRVDCRTGQSYPDHPERFDKWCQVLYQLCAQYLEGGVQQ
ncbi:tripartite motif-containing protein 16-like [Sardina pilchardus]|uniref:tripartite motif-containing protein 16-like n=1 Tax=Sardina pilchardus TaxID=27697 RepID=UPI002E133F20